MIFLMTWRDSDKAHRVRDHLSKLFKAEFSISIMVTFHYRLVDYLLELLILEKPVSIRWYVKCR